MVTTRSPSTSRTSRRGAPIVRPESLHRPEVHEVDRDPQRDDGGHNPQRGAAGRRGPRLKGRRIGGRRSAAVTDDGFGVDLSGTRTALHRSLLMIEGWHRSNMIPLRDIITCRTRPWVTMGLIVLNLAVFTYEAFLPDGATETFVRTYGLKAYAFSWPTVLTSMFIHGSLLH